MTGAFVGKTALVTGGGSGIGAATARRLVAEGARVLVTGRRPEPLERLVADFPEGSAVALSADVSLQEGVEAAVAAAAELGGGSLHVVVNNAGAGVGGTVEELDLEEWRRALDTNLTGAMLVMRASIPHLRASGGGAIVNVSSVAGLVASPGLAPYNTTKAALLMLTKQVALDVGADGIRVNAVCPGWVRSEMSDLPIGEIAAARGVDDATARSLASRHQALARIAEPGEIAAAICFLAGDDASFVTGAVLPVDGGASSVDAASLAFRPDA
jgi:meso-butanediol dehydrogenase/(S,S)-butanediol dehydrogenase/diacetyl reductase